MAFNSLRFGSLVLVSVYNGCQLEQTYTWCLSCQRTATAVESRDLGLSINKLIRGCNGFASPNANAHMHYTCVTLLPSFCSRDDQWYLSYLCCFSKRCNIDSLFTRWWCQNLKELDQKCIFCRLQFNDEKNALLW